jgi:hypothetical protein
MVWLSGPRRGANRIRLHDAPAGYRPPPEPGTPMRPAAATDAPGLGHHARRRRCLGAGGCCVPGDHIRAHRDASLASGVVRADAAAASTSSRICTGGRPSHSAMPRVTTVPARPTLPPWCSGSSPPALGGMSSTSAAGLASGPGRSSQLAAPFSASSPTRGWPSSRAATGSRSRWQHSRPGIGWPAVRRGPRRHGLALGGPGCRSSEGGPGNAARRV